MVSILTFIKNNGKESLPLMDNQSIEMLVREIWPAFLKGWTFIGLDIIVFDKKDCKLQF